MTKVFSVRIKESLFNKIIQELKKTDNTRNEFFEMLIDKYFYEKYTLKKLYTCPSELENIDGAYNLLHKEVDMLIDRKNKDFDKKEVF